MGSTLRPPDIIYMAVTAGAAIGVAAWLMEAGWVQVFAVAYIGFTMVALVLWYRLGLRRHGFHLYYRFFGPTCTINVWASLDVDANVSAQEHLEQVYQTAKHVIPSARVDMMVDNRSSISIGAQTLRATVVTRGVLRRNRMGRGMGRGRRAAGRGEVARDRVWRI